jgi:CRAL/TRIO domain
VWGWIKRWFDPVTVNKIFIIPQHEVKSRLSEFIHPDDFPKKYGGNLDWEFGMTPHLDQAALAAVEKNGSRGWIEGPCLWEQNQRVAVGTVGGKPRRPSKVEPIPVPAQAENKVEQAHPATTEPAEPMQTPAEAPAPALTPAEPEATDSSNPPSMAHSGSTVSTFAGTQPDALAATPTDGTAKVTENGAPVVVNGAVLNAGDAKPPMERFVTAFEDLHTARPQVNGVA